MIDGIVVGAFTAGAFAAGILLGWRYVLPRVLSPFDLSPAAVKANHRTLGHLIGYLGGLGVIAAAVGIASGSAAVAVLVVVGVMVVMQMAVVVARVFRTRRNAAEPAGNTLGEQQ